MTCIRVIQKKSFITANHKTNYNLNWDLLNKNLKKIVMSKKII